MVFYEFRRFDVLIPHLDNFPIHLIVVDIEFLSKTNFTCLRSMIYRMVALSAASSVVKLRLMLSESITEIKW